MTNGSSNGVDHPFQIQYSTFVILVLCLVTMAVVVDRFTSNALPSSLHGSPVVDGEWTATTFLVFGFMTGRELVAASSMLFLLQCRCLMNWCYEHKPHWLQIDDIVTENNRLHAYIGYVGVGIPCVLHCVLVFLPLLSPRISLQFFAHAWMKPAHIEVYQHSSASINLAWNEIYSIALICICFAFLFPFSMSRRLRDAHWTISQLLHIFAALVYTSELLRNEFNANCYFCTFPFVLLYVVDRFVIGLFFYRKNQASLVATYAMDESYVLLLFFVDNVDVDDPTHIARRNGDVFWFQFERTSIAHPFTTFYNHTNMSAAELFPYNAAERKPNHVLHKFPVGSTCMKRNSTRKHMRMLCANGNGNVNVNVNANETNRPPQQSQSSGRAANAKRSAPSISTSLLTRATSSEALKASMTASMDAIELCAVNIDTETATSVSSDDAAVSPPSVATGTRATTSVYIRDTGDGSRTPCKAWNIGVIMKVNSPGKVHSFGNRMYAYNAESERVRVHGMRAYGPYRTSFSSIFAVLNRGRFPVLLIGSGAGIGYIVDFYLRILKHREIITEKHSVSIFFSCRCVRLFQLITDLMCTQPMENIHICSHLTSQAHISPYDEGMDKLKPNKARIGRASFQDIFERAKPQTRVFFCGSPLLQNKIKRLCKEKRFKLFEGHTFM